MKGGMYSPKVKVKNCPNRLFQECILNINCDIFIIQSFERSLETRNIYSVSLSDSKCLRKFQKSAILSLYVMLLFLMIQRLMQGRRENILSPKILLKLSEFFFNSVLSLINLHFMNEHLIKATSVEESSLLQAECLMPVSN